MYKILLCQEGDNIQKRAVMMIISIMDHIGSKDPLKEEDITDKMKGHLIKMVIQREHIPEGDTPTEMEGLLEEEDPLMEEEPLMEEDPDGGGPPNDRGPPDEGPPDEGPPDGSGGPPGPPGGHGPPGPQGPPGPVRPIVVQIPQVTSDTSTLEHTFDSVGQSMLQLAQAQDQTNRQLQQHIQQGHLTMQTHTGALEQLATSSYQRNFNHIFASIPIYDGSDREGFFPWLEHLEAACLGRSTGPVQNVIMALPHARSWRAIREELKRCFSDQTSYGHVAAQLENMTQKPNEPLRLYIFRYSKIHKSITKRDACYDTNPSRWFRFLTSITNTTIADKITWSEFLPQNLQQCFEKALRLEASLQLPEGVNMA